MQLHAYLTSVAEDLERSTQLADDATRDIANRLIAVLEPGLRIAMVQLLSDAAAQLTAELSGPIVTVRMDGRDPVWNIVIPESHEPISLPAETALDDEGTARVTVRLPEAVKRRAEALAQASGQSLNTWISNALRSATSATPPATKARTNTSHRITGWA